jgi:predicted nucleic acid-binding protein
VAGVIVLDASVLIAHLDERDAQHALAVERLLAAAEHPLGCSSMTLAEVFVGPARHGRLQAARAAVAELGANEIGLGADAATRLASLRAETGLELPECCVLLAAEDERAVGVLTFDDRLSRAAEALGFTG